MSGETKAKIILAGGGTRYPCYVGVFAALEEEGIEPAEIVGTSAGAIIAAGRGAGMDSKELSSLAKQVLPRKLLDRNFWPFGGTKSWFRGKKILAALRANLPSTFEECPIPVHIVTHNYSTGVNQVHSSGDLPLAVRASMSLPVFDMVQIGKDLHEDGGYSGNFRVDYTDWSTDIDAPLIGVRFYPVVKGRRPPPKNKIERFTALLNDTLEANTHERLEDVLDLNVIEIYTEHPSLNLYMSEEDVEEMIMDGYLSTKFWLSLNKHLIIE